MKYLKNFIKQLFKIDAIAKLLYAILFKIVRCSMQLPNKLYPYEKSTLALIPPILKNIKNGKTNVKELFNSIHNQLDDSTDFLSAMDCLYALNVIEIIENGEI